MTACLYGADLRFSISGNSSEQRIGTSIVAVGDLNGDKYPDLAVGDPAFAVAGPGSTFVGSGRVLVVSGKNGSTLFTLQGTPATGQAFGTSLAAIRVDGDSKLDIVVGAPGGNGAVWIYSGANGSLLRTVASPLPTAGSSFGISLASAGDHNADGMADLFAVKMEPDRGFPQAASAHATFWDFISLTPESMHRVLWAMSDRAIRRSLRMIEGFGVHTFRLINAKGESRFVKFHWRPTIGASAVLWDEAVKISGADPDFHRRDLWEAIDNGDFPE